MSQPPADDTGNRPGDESGPSGDERSREEHAGQRAKRVRARLAGWPRAQRAGQTRAVVGVSIGVLTLLLGFAIAVQVHANSSSDSLSALRDDDLVSILDNQSDRADRLRQQIAQLQQNLRQLRDTGNRSAAARKQATAQAQALGILLGTLPATGPGVVVTVTDPESKLGGEDLLDVVEELRGAGAEAVQFGSVRVGTNSAFEGSGGDVRVDGTLLHAPYTVVAIGDSKTLDTALNIPGGIAASVRASGGELTVSERGSVTIRVTRAAPKIKYAHKTH